MLDLEGTEGDNVAVFVFVEHLTADSILSLELDTPSLRILLFSGDIGVVFKRSFPNVLELFVAMVVIGFF